MFITEGVEPWLQGALNPKGACYSKGFFEGSFGGSGSHRGLGFSV